MKNMNWLFLACILMTITVSGCKKSDKLISVEESLMVDAKQIFEKTVAEKKLYFRNKNLSLRHKLPRKPIWEQSYITQFGGFKALVVPVRYDKPLIIKSNFAGNNLYNINDLSNLIIYEDAKGGYNLELVTAFPDSNYKKQKFTGVIAIEDWFGAPKMKYKHEKTGKVKKLSPQQTPAIDLSQTEINGMGSIHIDYYIEGWNYSAGDPDGTHWIEYVGGNTYFTDAGVGARGGNDNNENYGDFYDPGGFGGGGGGGISPIKEISIIAGNIPIPKVQEYNKCFTNIPGSTNSYQVTICVSQPNPGSREPWVTSGEGSSKGNNPVFVGHTFLILSQQSSTQTVIRNIGFYPKSGVHPLAPHDDGQLMDDSQYEYDIAVTVNMPSSQFFQLLDYLVQAQNSGMKYNLNYNNCTTFALNSLAAIGINLPRTKGSWPNGEGLNPGDLGEDLRKMALQSNMTKTVTYGKHANKGVCY